MTSKGTFTPLKTKQALEAIRAHVGRVYSGKPMDCPIKLYATFYMPRPKTVKLVYPARKPDCDNCMKLLGDALEGVLWTNDSRIVDLVISKRYVTDGMLPCIQLKVFAYI